MATFNMWPTSQRCAHRFGNNTSARWLVFATFLSALFVISTISIAGTPEELVGYGLPRVDDIYVGPPLPYDGAVSGQSSSPEYKSSSVAQSTSGSSTVGTISGQFSVSPTGAASYAVPISVPPGTAGMQPKLALKYSSQAGNGQLGMGWSLDGLSSITRCSSTLAHDGFIDGVDFDANDRLCLDGQRLVPNPGYTYGTSSAYYHKEVDDLSRVQAFGAINDGGSTYEIRTKAGLIYTYGGGSASFQRPGFNEAYVWAVGEIRDTLGNGIKITYAQDGTTREYFLSRIDYTTRFGAPTGYNYIDFVYNSNRPDKNERYLAGGSQKITSTRLLTHIRTFADNAQVREYRLAYDQAPDTQRSRLTSLIECAYQGGTPYCLNPTAFNWQSKTPGFDRDPPGTLTAPHNLNGTGGWPLAEAMDVNGDGLVDWVLSAATGENGGPPYHRTTWINRRTGWEPHVYSNGVNDGYAVPSFAYVVGARFGEFADLNADGLPWWWEVRKWGADRGV